MIAFRISNLASNTPNWNIPIEIRDPLPIKCLDLKHDKAR